ncbi:phage tail tape measure protein [Brevundimonas sp. A19_0]|uniref:phage tail tape measure protein n=1 Tax=Brevundimonas sp. A19_0 TaxID=2821087 RepID=UPI001ADCC45B|nr:phage tail tape measure protein [Brevundimonas sp. A19_0]MBO9500749.1 phage tail tape measure protein [Brevundimonas sp. A19_0]
MKVGLTEVRTSLSAAKAEAERLGKAMDTTEKPTRQLTKAFEAATNKVKTLEQRQASHVQGLRDLDEKLKAAGVSTKALGAHELRLERDLAKANDALQEQARRLDAVTERQKRLAGARAQYDKTQQLAGTMQGAGMSSLAAGGAVAAPLVMSGRSAMAFEESMAEVLKVVDFPTPKAFAEMERDILNLSGRLPVTSGELAGLVAQGARAGVARQDLLAYAEAAAKMGVAFDISSEDAGTMMATWRAALGLTQKEVITLADQVNYLTNTYGGNAAEVSNMITRVGPLADVAGASGSVLAALAQVMNKVGVEAEVGATGIKNLLLGLTRGEAATKKQREAFASLGLDASTMAKRMQTDAEGAITSVLQAVARLPQERQLSILSNLFGTESVAAIAPMLSQIGLVEQNLRAVGDASLYAGAMTTEFNRATDTSASRWTIAGNKGNRLATILGNRLKPTIDAASDAFGKATDALAAFAERHPGVTGAVLGVVGVLAAGLIVFGGLALAVAAVLGPFALMRLAMTQTGLLFGPLVTGLKNARWATLGFNSALLANPMLWIAVAIAAAVALVAYVIYRNWGRIGPWLRGLWDGITRTVSGGLSLIKAYILNFTPLGFVIRNWQPIVGFLSALWTLAGELVGLGLDYAKYLLVRFSPMPWVRKAWSAVTGFLGGVWEGANKAVGKGLSLIGDGLMRFTPLGFIVRNWDAISGFLLEVWGRYKAAVQTGLDAIGGLLMRFAPLAFVVNNWGPISEFVTGLWDKVKGAVSTGIDAMKAVIRKYNPLDDFKAVFKDLWNWLSELPGKLLKAGADAVNGFTQGIRGRRADVQAATAEVARVPEATTRRVTQTRSPSRVMMNVGRDVMSGFTLGLGQNRRGPAGVMAGAAAALIAAGAVSMPGVRGGDIDGTRGVSALARPTFDTGPRLSARPSTASASGARPPDTPAIGTLNLTINQRPGEDVDALARRVVELLRKPDLSSLSDDPDYGEA